MPPVTRQAEFPLPLVAALIVVSCFLVRCTRQEETETRPDNRNLSNSASTFIYNAIPDNPQAIISPEYTAAINAFSVNLLDEVYKSDSFHNRNVVLSPYCISRNLAIITEATRGDSKQELLDALGGKAALDDATSALSRLLYADNSVILQIADAIWINSARCSLQPSFRDTANTKYGVEVSELDFGRVGESVSAINKWITDNTGNRISDAVDESLFEQVSVLLLTSAIYFEADWTSPFDVTKTEPCPFATPAGTVEVPMMTSSYQHRTFKCAEYENAKLYYGKGGKDFFYLDVYMPVTISVEEFITEKCAEALGKKDSMGYGGLRMPKFFFEQEIDLEPVLKSMGVNGIFDDGKSEITGMASYKDTQDTARLYVECIIHKAGIKTDEEGSVAYAVTVTGATDNAAGQTSPDVILDRPFVYFIRAGATGLILFAGVVNDPIEKA